MGITESQCLNKGCCWAPSETVSFSANYKLAIAMMVTRLFYYRVGNHGASTRVGLYYPNVRWMDLALTVVMRLITNN